MRVCFVVFVLVATFLASSTALPTSTGLSSANLVKNGAIEAVAPHASRNDKRFLRSNEEGDEVDNENRDLSGLIKAIKSMSSRTTRLEYLDAEKLKKINKYFEKGVSYEQLYKKKVDQYDVFRALKISEKAKDSKERLWWLGYNDYWVAMKAGRVKGG
ncbi:hypothetical protein PR003_g25632 [Phytophthora rubi]|uniref:RxLR effector protein n=1 Tax=Phytophthora rubi TaxID=129364 RepID=A0A6A3IK50_9STRA|nr:hypothetical protein PR002_g24706 [Phytophthora rubi]KAE8980063.1 hypothetical protein PR001_g24377 [Phytophthora rubi]KAE9289163.1 hypothetical protein PR003_g25632 [Phytophthora rubi]